MEKSLAISDSLAVLHYWMVYYPNEIVSYTKYTLSITVTLHLDWKDYDSKKEKEKIERIAIAGAKIEILSNTEMEFDVIYVSYGIEN